MKSGEEVIADVYEIRDAEQKPQGFILRDPQICKIFKNMEEPEKGPNVTFENWAPLSSQKKFLVKEHAFLTMCDPLPPLAEHFVERFGEGEDSLDPTNLNLENEPSTDSPTEEPANTPDTGGTD
jgi:hypothetical protein